MQALICTGGRGPSGLPPGIVRNPQVVICADSGYALARTLGLEPDFLVGDLDSISEVPTGCVVERYPPEKDSTDTELALRKAQQLGCTDIVLLGGGNHRLDHLLGLVWLYEGTLCPDIWVTENAILYYVTSKWMAALSPGEIISIFPLGAPPWILKSSGLRWNLDAVQWKRFNTGISNYATHHQVAVHVTQGRLLLLRHLPPLYQQ